MKTWIKISDMNVDAYFQVFKEVMNLYKNSDLHYEQK